jgi:AraC-like DNA-binding protein/quercetin dioxygenase-like cupin family protein
VGIEPLGVLVDHAHFMNKTVLKGTGVRPHEHDQLQIQTAISGEFVFYGGKERVLISRGSSCLIRNGATHSWECTEPGVLLGTMLRPADDNRYLDVALRFTDERAIISASGPAVNRRAIAMARIASEPPDGWIREKVRFHFGLWLAELLPCFLRTSLNQEPVPEAEATRPEQAIRLKRIEAFVRSNLNQSLSLSDIAREVGVSTRQLTRIFRQEKNQSLHNFIMEMRLKEALRLLRDSPNPTVKGVAYACGFREPSYFSRCFRERYGNSPSEELELQKKS